MKMRTHKRFILSIYIIIFIQIEFTNAQCPWHRDVPDLQTSCLCAYNLGQELSVQCDQVSDNHRTKPVTQTLNFIISLFFVLTGRLSCFSQCLRQIR
jgi:hypothetical protein